MHIVGSCDCHLRLSQFADRPLRLGILCSGADAPNAVLSGLAQASAVEGIAKLEFCRCLPVRMMS